MSDLGGLPPTFTTGEARASGIHSRDLYASRDSGVIIEPGQDLGVRAGGQRVMGEVRLPALVRQLGLEPDAGGSRALAGLGGDQPGPGQVPADRRG